MKRIGFNSEGRMISIDNATLDIFNGFNDVSESDSKESAKLRTSQHFELLEDSKVYDNRKERQYWSLYDKSGSLEPLKFSNGKTQEDVVKEVINLIKQGNKIVFIHGVCGTGKSAIALNIARALGRASIVVPIKSLQRQYEEDYMGNKYLLKDGNKMKIRMITGRDNHDSLFFPGVSCADPFLPDTIKITEKNYGKIADYYEKNPLIKKKRELVDVRDLRRISIAPTNPYWSPIVQNLYELPLNDAVKKRYRGLQGKEFIIYQRKKGCSYYDQYEAYLNADVIIFNSAKYKIECLLNRKPETDIEIIDEADEFLDNFSTQNELNLTRLSSSLAGFYTEDEDVKASIKDIVNMIKLEEKNKNVLGVDERKIYHIKETQIDKILQSFIKNPALEVELSLDEMSYANNAVEVASEFKDFISETYVSFKRKENDLFVSLVTTNLSKKFEEIVKNNKAFVLMSGTLHSESVLKNIFGIENYKIVDAETYHQGMIEIQRTGSEIDCKYANFSSGKHNREEYLKALSLAMEKAKKPVLIHVNAFEDLPSKEERDKLKIFNIMDRETLLDLQRNDKTGRMISLFKAKMTDSLFTTKCSRGIDFPGDTCNSVIFTKYPNPNVNGIFWKVLMKTHRDYYWDFYFDKAKRDFLQRIYRAVRSNKDHVFVLSPDSRVLDAVRKIQNY